MTKDMVSANWYINEYNNEEICSKEESFAVFAVTPYSKKHVNININNQFAIIRYIELLNCIYLHYHVINHSIWYR